MIALGEGTFGLLVLTGHPPLWQMIVLEALTGTGMAIFYPASQALLPRLVPGDAAAGGQRDQPAGDERRADGRRRGGRACASRAVGPGWALAVCGVGMLGTVPLLLTHPRPAARARGQRAPACSRELREGWSEFRSHTWLWVDRGPVRRGHDGLVRRVPGARAGGGQDAPGRPGGLGRDHRRRVASA